MAGPLARGPRGFRLSWRVPPTSPHTTAGPATGPTSGPGAARRLALIALVIGVVSIGFAPIFMRLSELGPNGTAVYRVAMALPFLLLWLGFERSPRAKAAYAKPKGGDWAILALSGLFWSGDLVFWHWSVSLTNVANATFFATSSPIFVIAGAWLFFRERITKGFFAGFLLTLAGGALLFIATTSFGGGDLLGDVFGAVTAFFFGSYMLTIKHLRGRLPTGMIMFWSGLFSLPGLVLAALLTGEGFVAESLTGWAVLIGLALIVHVVGQGLAAYALAHLPASFTSVAFLGEPVVAAIAGWVILKEALGPLQGAGCTVILAGVWLAQRYGLARRSAAPAG